MGFSYLAMCPPSTLLTNQTLAAVVCSTSNDVCTAICANTDLAGIGVRVAFYAQSAINSECINRVTLLDADCSSSL